MINDIIINYDNFNSEDPDSLYKLSRTLFNNTKSIKHQDAREFLKVYGNGEKYTEEQLPPIIICISNIFNTRSLYDILHSLYKAKVYIEELDKEYKRLIKSFIINNLDKQYKDHSFKLYKFGYRNNNTIIPLSRHYDDVYMILYKFIRSKEIDKYNFYVHPLAEEIKQYIQKTPQIYGSLDIMYDPHIPTLLVMDDKFLYKLYLNKTDHKVTKNLLHYKLIDNSIELYKLFSNTIYSEFGWKPSNLLDTFFKDNIYIDSLHLFDDNGIPTYQDFRNLITELRLIHMNDDKLFKNSVFDFFSDENIF